MSSIKLHKQLQRPQVRTQDKSKVGENNIISKILDQIKKKNH